MTPVYPEELRERPVALDTSGNPIPPAAEGFQNLGQVYGTSTNNAYTAEQDQNYYNSLLPAQRSRQFRDEQLAETAAMRYAGQEKFRQLIAGGARPEEALRVAAPELFWNNPAALTSAIRFTKPQPEFNPTLIPVEGGRVFRQGPNSAQFIPNPKPVMPPDVAANQKILTERLKAMRSGPLALAADPNEVGKLEQQIVEGSTNWMGRGTSPAATEEKSPFKEGQTVRNKKDGKLYKIVKGVPVLQE